jgi:hypothetical protein
MAEIVRVRANECGFLFTTDTDRRQVATEVVQRSSVLRALLSDGPEFVIPAPKMDTYIWLEAVSSLMGPLAHVPPNSHPLHLQCSLRLAQYLQVHTSARLSLFQGVASRTIKPLQEVSILLHAFCL